MENLYTRLSTASNMGNLSSNDQNNHTAPADENLLNNGEQDMRNEIIKPKSNLLIEFTALEVLSQGNKLNCRVDSRIQ